MAGIDHSIYFQQQPLDLFGSVQRGLSLRDSLDQKNAQKLQLQQQADVDNAYRSGFVQNPDGTSTFDNSKALNALGMLTGNPYAGKAALSLGNDMYQRQMQTDKIRSDAEQRLIDNQLRRDQLASAAADRKEARDERRFQAGLVRDEKMQALKTPYGLANTVDDAKQLKEAHESKATFDNKLQQMIALREKHGGGAVWNREDVARGKQLSKDLLLEYKNMAKLGVLSKSDEDIINAIIPEDPLEFNSPLASVRGEDPTLARLKSFMSDSDKDFKNRIATRTREGIAGNRPSDPLHGPSSVRMIAPDGSVRMVPRNQVQSALNSGGKLAE